MLAAVRFTVQYDAEYSMDIMDKAEFDEYPVMSNRCKHCEAVISWKRVGRGSPNRFIDVHRRTGRIRCYTSWPEERQYLRPKGYLMAERRVMAFEEYLDTYGNPGNYDAWGVKVERYDLELAEWVETDDTCWGFEEYIPDGLTAEEGTFTMNEFLEEVRRHKDHDSDWWQNIYWHFSHVINEVIADDLASLNKSLKGPT